MSAPAERKPLSGDGKFEAASTQSQWGQKTNFNFCFGSHCSRSMRGFTILRAVITSVVLFRLFFSQFQIEESRDTLSIFQFNLSLVYVACNILITALLWAGTFGKKKMCLPIYVFSEVIFTFCWFLVFFRNGLSNEMQYVGYGIFGAVLIFFLVFFCGVLSPYYVYLRIKGREEKIQLKRIVKLLTRKEGRSINEV
ncbi:hypothetical protein PRIPAC_90238 [Pristionchus pacificus]|uniref:Uncharacterized protein n=1 Tax=Pristionchus pacificus TaxID=54126 RepID=A0A2A6B5V2_PRIPA|nr:hypothetical protein PRIPAC_90238 [Pristionchus pacificus]|eukprot:PDM61256.1 hypothetical protein PRIPAC_50698 [Pristionchus pacificus]